jgi:hypothetical protein
MTDVFQDGSVAADTLERSVTREEAQYPWWTVPPLDAVDTPFAFSVLRDGNNFRVMSSVATFNQIGQARDLLRHWQESCHCDTKSR